MISKKRLEKFNNKKPWEPLDDYEMKHFDELMNCTTFTNAEKFCSQQNFHEAVEETIKDLDNLLS